MTPELEFGYVVGLFDGEGSCGVRTYRATKNGEKYARLEVTITNTNRGCLERARTFFGHGWIVSNGKTVTGKPIFRWRTQGKKGKEFLLLVRPYVSAKIEQIDRVLAKQHFGRV